MSSGFLTSSSKSLVEKIASKDFLPLLQEKNYSCTYCMVTSTTHNNQTIHMEQQQSIHQKKNIRSYNVMSTSPNDCSTVPLCSSVLCLYSIGFPFFMFLLVVVLQNRTNPCGIALVSLWSIHSIHHAQQLP